MYADTPDDSRISKDEFHQFQGEIKEATDKLTSDVFGIQKQLLIISKRLDALQGHSNGGQTSH